MSLSKFVDPIGGRGTGIATSYDDDIDLRREGRRATMLAKRRRGTFYPIGFCRVDSGQDHSDSE